MTNTLYMGSELELFANAMNWKRYFGNWIIPFFGQKVLEAGAGIGETPRHLCVNSHQRWHCLEPDREFCDTIQAKIDGADLPAICSVRHATREILQNSGDLFDTILYIDVLEHLQADRDELVRASRLLTDDGAIVVISPAHNFLFSLFDTQVGHYRRYDKKLINIACPEKMTIAHAEYLDSVGMLASLANRCLLKRAIPGHRQVAFWDKLMDLISRVVDPLCFNLLGKSLFALFRKGQK